MGPVTNFKTFVVKDHYVYELHTVQGSTRLAGQTIPQPQRTRIDGSLRAIVEALGELEYKDQDEQK